MHKERPSSPPSGVGSTAFGQVPVSGRLKVQHQRSRRRSRESHISPERLAGLNLRRAVVQDRKDEENNRDLRLTAPERHDDGKPDGQTDFSRERDENSKVEGDPEVQRTAVQRGLLKKALAAPTERALRETSSTWKAAGVEVPQALCNQSARSTCLRSQDPLAQSGSSFLFAAASPRCQPSEGPLSSEYLQQRTHPSMFTLPVVCPTTAHTSACPSVTHTSGVSFPAVTFLATPEKSDGTVVPVPVPRMVPSTCVLVDGRVIVPCTPGMEKGEGAFNLVLPSPSRRAATKGKGPGTGRRACGCPARMCKCGACPPKPANSRRQKGKGPGTGRRACGCPSRRCSCGAAALLSLPDMPVVVPVVVDFQCGLATPAAPLLVPSMSSEKLLSGAPPSEVKGGEKPTPPLPHPARVQAGHTSSKSLKNGLRFCGTSDRESALDNSPLGSLPSVASGSSSNPAVHGGHVEGGRSVDLMACRPLEDEMCDESQVSVMCNCKPLEECGEVEVSDAGNKKSWWFRGRRCEVVETVPFGEGNAESGVGAAKNCVSVRSRVEQQCRGSLAYLSRSEQEEQAKKETWGERQLLEQLRCDETSIAVLLDEDEQEEESREWSSCEGDSLKSVPGCSEIKNTSDREPIPCAGALHGNAGERASCRSQLRNLKTGGSDMSADSGVSLQERFSLDVPGLFLLQHRIIGELHHLASCEDACAVRKDTAGSGEELEEQESHHNRKSLESLIYWRKVGSQPAPTDSVNGSRHLLRLLLLELHQMSSCLSCFGSDTAPPVPARARSCSIVQSTKEVQLCMWAQHKMEDFQSGQGCTSTVRCLGPCGRRFHVGCLEVAARWQCNSTWGYHRGDRSSSSPVPEMGAKNCERPGTASARVAAATTESTCGLSSTDSCLRAGRESVNQLHPAAAQLDLATVKENGATCPTCVVWCNVFLTVCQLWGSPSLDWASKTPRASSSGLLFGGARLPLTDFPCKDLFPPELTAPLFGFCVSPTAKAVLSKLSADDALVHGCGSQRTPWNPGKRMPFNPGISCNLTVGVRARSALGDQRDAMGSLPDPGRTAMRPAPMRALFEGQREGSLALGANLDARKISDQAAAPDSPLPEGDGVTVSPPARAKSERLPGEEACLGDGGEGDLRHTRRAAGHQDVAGSVSGRITLDWYVDKGADPGAGLQGDHSFGHSFHPAAAVSSLEPLTPDGKLRNVGNMAGLSASGEEPSSLNRAVAELPCWQQLPSIMPSLSGPQKMSCFTPTLVLNMPGAPSCCPKSSEPVDSLLRTPGSRPGPSARVLHETSPATSHGGETGAEHRWTERSSGMKRCSSSSWSSSSWLLGPQQSDCACCTPRKRPRKQIQPKSSATLAIFA